MRKFEAMLWWGIPLVLVATATATPITSVIALALALALIACAVLPLNALIFLFAMLLPIWSVGSLDPIYFDAARAGVALLVLVKSKPTARRMWGRRSWSVAAPLLVVAIFVLALGLTRPDSSAVSIGVTMLLSIVVAWAVLARLDNPWPLLNGYLVGLMLSAAVMFLTAAGITVLTPQVDAGFFRLAGLSPSATLVTYQMALGVVIAWAATGRGESGTWYRLVLVVSLLAVILSGGRGGVAALAMALVVSIRWGWFRPIHAVALGIVGWFVISQASAFGLVVNTLERFTSASASNLPDGRFALFDNAIESVASHPLTGQGLPDFESTYGGGPHFAILSFSVAGGLLCGLLILWVMLILVRRLGFLSPKPYGLAGKAGHLMLAVLIATSILEPTGPFVGAEFVTMLLLSVGLTSVLPPDERHAAIAQSVGVASTGPRRPGRAG